MRPLVYADEALAPPCGHLWHRPSSAPRAPQACRLQPENASDGNKATVQKPERETLEEPSPKSEGIEEGSGSRDDMQKDGAL